MTRGASQAGGFVRSVEIVVPPEERLAYPLNLPALRNVRSLPLDPAMTILVGENGSGKSTLVEGIGVAAGFNAEGGSANFRFRTQRHEPELARHLRLVRNPVRPSGGFFLRAESFFNVATEIERLDEEPGGGGRIGPAYGPRPLHEVSHGESFLSLALYRFRPRGLYVLDEPEAAMSPTGCLALLRRFADLARAGCQFIVATHSPVLMAFPGALIYELTGDGPRRTSWADVGHVRIMREFLDQPEAVLEELFTAD